MSAWAPLTVPLSVSESLAALAAMVLGDASVTAPPSEAVPVPIRAPVPPAPAPFSVTASAPIATLAICRVALFATVVPAAVAPSAAAFAGDQRAGIDGGRTSVGVGPRERDRSAGGLVQTHRTPPRIALTVPDCRS